MCSAGLDFVYFIQHISVHGNTVQSNLIVFRMPVSQA
jgi:hypothetical protein